MTGSSPLIHCVYTSTLSPDRDQSDLVSILSTARRRNASIGATGVLLYCNRSFFQVLEGPPGPIGDLYRRIAIDPRHQGVTKLIEAPIEARSFRDWTMGLVEITPTELGEVPGLEALIRSGRALADVDQEGAHSLLAALCRGRWRMRCETAMVSSLLDPAH